MKALLLEKRGCDFWKDEPKRACTDLDNYRLCTFINKVHGKDKKEYFLEFTTWDRFTYRNTNKRTGAPLKKPVRELMLYNALGINTQYENEAGAWRNVALETHLYNMLLTFTSENILKVVNFISKEPYEKIIILDTHDMWRCGTSWEREILRNAKSFEIIDHYLRLYSGENLKGDWVVWNLKGNYWAG